MKPPLATSRKKGYVIVGYIDDTLLLDETKEQLVRTVQDTVDLLRRLGFLIHDKRSVFSPSEKVVFLGFEINCVSMTVQLMEAKRMSIVRLCKTLQSERTSTIHEVASVIGKLVSSFPGVQFGPPLSRIGEEQDCSVAAQ